MVISPSCLLLDLRLTLCWGGLSDFWQRPMLLISLHLLFSFFTNELLNPRFKFIKKLHFIYFFIFISFDWRTTSCPLIYHWWKHLQNRFYLINFGFELCWLFHLFLKLSFKRYRFVIVRSFHTFMFFLQLEKLIFQNSIFFHNLLI